MKQRHQPKPQREPQPHRCPNPGCRAVMMSRYALKQHRLVCREEPRSEGATQ